MYDPMCGIQNHFTCNCLISIQQYLYLMQENTPLINLVYNEIKPLAIYLIIHMFTRHASNH